MTVTQKLLQVFLVDKQLRGLESRLKASEKYLAEQSGQLGQIDTRRTGLEGQVRQLTATVADRQGEVARLEEKLKVVRGRMETAQTNKEYQAFLTELNTFTADRDKNQTEVDELSKKLAELKTQLDGIQGERDDRSKLVKIAEDERNTRAGEIKERLEKLKAERAALVAEVPKDALKTFEQLIRARGDDAMAQIEIQDRKRHEYNCSACMMSIPVETISSVLGSGRLTLCVSCGCILYITDEDTKTMQEPAPGAKGSKTKKTKTA
ncbi:MAG TPA: DUF2968 domain-containing protein [Phycisphaerales bacterium]|nr:DUF2968 domain-containing protein [Phycisphaerales bacterium]